MTFDQAQDYLLSLMNIPRTEYMSDSNHCIVYMKRLQFFLDLLGNPEKHIPHYIHITGTSGKGSVTSYVHSILHTNKEQVGMLQSPHPTDIRERWTVGDKIMSKKEFVSIVETLKPVLDQHARTCPYEMISFFELTTAIGLYYFAQKKVTWCLLEVGCGGRFDATNIIPHKDISIITNIGLDHVGLIGDTKEEIAYEKAGIIKKGSCVFTMEDNPKIRAIIEKEAKKEKTQLRYIPKAYVIEEESFERTIFSYQDDKYLLYSLGKHQVRNATLAIEVAQALGVPHQSIKKGLAIAKQPIRMEQVHKEPYIILDGAHNEDKMKACVETILSVRNKGQRIHLVLGFSYNKEVEKMIHELARLKPMTVACTRNTMNPYRKVKPPTYIAQMWKQTGVRAKKEMFLDPKEALGWAISRAKNNDIVLVTGSTFLAGELRGHL